MNKTSIKEYNYTSDTSAENTSRSTVMVRTASRIYITPFPQERQILDFVSETILLCINWYKMYVKIIIRRKLPVKASGNVDFVAVENDDSITLEKRLSNVRC